MQQKEVTQLICCAEIEQGHVGCYVGVVDHHGYYRQGCHDGDKAAERARLGVVGHRFEQCEHVGRKSQKHGDAHSHDEGDRLVEVDGVEYADNLGNMQIGWADKAETEEYPPGSHDAEQRGADRSQVHYFHLRAAEEEEGDVDDKGILRRGGGREEEEYQEDAADASVVAVTAVKQNHAGHDDDTQHGRCRQLGQQVWCGQLEEGEKDDIELGHRSQHIESAVDVNRHDDDDTGDDKIDNHLGQGR